MNLHKNKDVKMNREIIMKKMKKIMTILLAMVMVVTTLVGCGDKTDVSSMFDVINQMTTVEKGTFVSTINVNMEGTSSEIVVSGKMDEDTQAFSIELLISGMSFDLEDIVIIDENMIYINVAEIIDTISPLLGLYGVDMEEYGITTNWISYEFDSELLQDEEMMNTMLEAVETAYGDMVTEEDGMYTLNIESRDDVNSMLEATETMLQDHQEDWIALLLEKYNAVDSEEMFNNFIDEFIVEVGTYGSEVGMEFSEDELSMLKDQLTGSYTETESTMDETTLTEEYNEMIVALDNMKSELSDEEFQDGEGIVISAKAEDDAYIMNMTMDFMIPEDMEMEYGYSGEQSMTVETIVTEDSSVSIDVPSEDECTSLPRVAAIAYVTYYSSMMGMDY